MGKPFKVNNPPLKNENETRPVASPPPGKQIVHSRQSGDPLPPSGTDGVDHPPEIKWPPAGGPDDAHKPFKNAK